MARTQMTEEQKEEFQVYFGFKSKLGIFWIVQCVFALLAVIGFLCPLFSYNLTKLDALKETVSLMDVPVAIVGLVFLVVAIVLTMVTVTLFQKAIVGGTQAALAKKLTGIAVGVGVSVLLSIVAVCVAYVLYDVPSSEHAYIELDFEAGFYLFIIGSALFFLLDLLYMAVARNLLSGKIGREQLLLFKKKENEEAEKSECGKKERTLEEKLTELKRLRDAGILSEEEFEAKKRELLNNLK